MDVIRVHAGGSPHPSGAACTTMAVEVHVLQIKGVDMTGEIATSMRHEYPSSVARRVCLPKDGEADIDEEIGTASSDHEHTDRWY